MVLITDLGCKCPEGLEGVRQGTSDECVLVLQCLQHALTHTAAGSSCCSTGGARLTSLAPCALMEDPHSGDVVASAAVDVVCRWEPWRHGCAALPALAAELG